MTHECSCRHDHTTPVTIPKRARAVSAEQTVAEISRDPRGLAILQAMGIDHCCGAHLPLAQAAAAAGVSVEAVLAALEAGVPA